jgi:hypothetical protein
MRYIVRFGRRGVVLLAALVVVLVASFTASAAPSASSAGVAVGPKPMSPKQWQALVAKAKAEGEVAFYSGQAPAVMENMAAKFEPPPLSWTR